jgi:hypothetical protein
VGRLPYENKAKYALPIAVILILLGVLGAAVVVEQIQEDHQIPVP